MATPTPHAVFDTNLTHLSPADAQTDPQAELWTDRLDRAFPWLSSLMMHVGLGLLVIFALCIFVGTPSKPDPIPFTETFQPQQDPGLLPAFDPNPVDATKLPGAATISPLTGRGMPSVGSVIKASTTDQVTIGTGPTTVYGPATTQGIIPGGGDFLGVPASSTGGKGGDVILSQPPRRIVYIVDTSGSMQENFDFLRSEMKRSVKSLTPLQFFGVVLFSEHAHAINNNHLVRAVPDSRNAFDHLIDSTEPAGENDGLYEPFAQAFDLAFAMKPQVIFFLTDGHFDPRLIDHVKDLNPNAKIRVHTLAFIHHEPAFEKDLQTIAAQNAGRYKFVSEEDLGR